MDLVESYRCVRDITGSLTSNLTHICDFEISALVGRATAAGECRMPDRTGVTIEHFNKAGGAEWCY